MKKVDNIQKHAVKQKHITETTQHNRDREITAADNQQKQHNS